MKVSVRHLHLGEWYMHLLYNIWLYSRDTYSKHMNISTIIELEYQVELEIPNRISLPLLDNMQ